MQQVGFAPQLGISGGTMDISFYSRAFNAIELRRFTNDDGSVHVAEFALNGMLFHLHEENLGSGFFAPEKINGTSVIIGLFVHDVDEVMSRALAAGAKLLSPPRDYEYGYRQGTIRDPFGHHWLIEKMI